MTTTRECDQCGEHRQDVEDRPNGCSECQLCWRASLQHGHEHGLHMDQDGNPVDVPDCPLCEGIKAFGLLTGLL
jgi:hypothetical protein